MYTFAFAALVKTEGNRRAAVANMFRAADNLRSVNMSQRDVVCRWEVLRREGVQRTDINVTYGVAFTGSDGGQMPGRNDGKIVVAAQRAGILILLLIIVGDCAQ